MTLTYNIAQTLIDRYATGPSQPRVEQVKNLHETIRTALESHDSRSFDTFLQGSYRNGTAIADINDVDIVALYDPWSIPKTPTEWEDLFTYVARILRNSSLIHGSVTLGDKCVKLKGALDADIVPAISRSTYSFTDPIYAYSRSSQKEISNYPRTHYKNGVEKQGRAADNFKATTRLFKRWVRQYSSLNAPSFYIECTVHSVPNDKFHTYLPLSFASAATKIGGYTSTTYIPSVAGDKDILVPDEWNPSDFVEFQKRLLADLKFILSALEASTMSEANRLWKLAFGEQS